MSTASRTPYATDDVFASVRSVESADAARGRRGSGALDPRRAEGNTSSVAYRARRKGYGFAPPLRSPSLNVPFSSNGIVRMKPEASDSLPRTR